jgi:hypothetical protein
MVAGPLRAQAGALREASDRAVVPGEGAIAQLSLRCLPLGGDN